MKEGCCLSSKHSKGEEPPSRRVETTDSFFGFTTKCLTVGLEICLHKEPPFCVETSSIRKKRTDCLRKARTNLPGTIPGRVCETEVQNCSYVSFVVFLLFCNSNGRGH